MLWMKSRINIFYVRKVQEEDAKLWDVAKILNFSKIVIIALTVFPEPRPRHSVEFRQNVKKSHLNR